MAPDLGSITLSIPWEQMGNFMKGNAFMVVSELFELAKAINRTTDCVIVEPSYGSVNENCTFHHLLRFKLGFIQRWRPASSIRGKFTFIKALNLQPFKLPRSIQLQ